MKKRKNHAKRQKAIAVFLALALVLTLVPVTDARAASYRGSGTMADPYLVETAEQLQGMRENLSAHYKLANTIDCSGITDFKPIGRMNAPFTGSFTCELNADKTPKYIIKNLTVSVVASAYVSDTESKWESALFGATNGSTIAGIYVLDAKIGNDNVGDNTGGVAYGNYKPGMDSMSAAILIGEAESSTIVNCGTTGVINAKSNYSAGMIGTAKNCVIEDCYSTAEVKSSGKWNIGGLCGIIKNSTVNRCFATGDVTGGQSNIGTFSGFISDTAVTDCYATGNASGGNQHKTAFGICGDKDTTTYVNCYTVGNVDGDGNTGGRVVNATNCWTLQGKATYMNGFSEGTSEQIKVAFSGWDTSGTYPKLTTIGVVTDASAYTPGAVSDVPEGNTAGANGTGTTDGTGNTGNAATTISSDEVKVLIEALPDPTVENSITADDKDAIKEAWKAYESMSVTDKDAFDGALLAKLTACRTAVSLLIVGDWITAVEGLPEVEDLTLEHIETINSLWEDYLFLDEELKEEIDQEIIDKMEAAHKYAEENANVIPGETIEVDASLTKRELALVVFCLTVFALVLLFQLYVVLVVLKRGKDKGETIKSIRKDDKKNEKEKNQQG